MNTLDGAGVPGGRALRGNPSELRSIAHALMRSTDVLGSSRQLSQGISHFDRAGTAASIRRLSASSVHLRREVEHIADLRQQAALVIDAYAHRLAELQREAHLHRRHLEDGEVAALDLERALAHCSAEEGAVQDCRQACSRQLAEVARANAAARKALEELDSLREHADSQCVTRVEELSSQIGSASPPQPMFGAGTMARGPRLPNAGAAGRDEFPRSPRAMLRDLPEIATVSEVEEWWNCLGPSHQAALLRADPLRLGNLNGIPIESRIQANAITAEGLLARQGLSDREREYWRKAASGEVRLVSLNPQEFRIIEMLGEIGPQTTFAATFLPGTTASMDKFFDGGPQAVGSYLAGEKAGSKGVVFVYKDGPWATWVGERSNRSEQFAKSAGEQVARFQHEVVERDPVLSRKKLIGVGHSAGLSCLTASENAGAHFRMVFSLGGSWIAPGWSQQPGTEYHHLQYDQDMINRLDHLGKYETPHAHPEQFAPHVFPGNGQGELRGHARIAEDERTNWDPLAEIVDIIEERNGTQNRAATYGRHGAEHRNRG